jgi:hypothetical protein
VPTPNLLAHVVFYAWPLVVFILFRRLPPAPALAWSMLAGYLLLPNVVGIDLPGFPTVDKDGLPVGTAFLLLLFGIGGAATAKAEGRRRWWWLTTLLLVVALTSPLLTVMNNPEPLQVGPEHVLPGLRPYDGASFIAGLFISFLPFLLAQRYFASPESHVLLLRVLVLGILVYSLPILFEVRMSPQLNIMFYGFFPHAFDQHMRGDGFRPVVFLEHGLWLAILVAMAAIAAAALFRQRLSEGQRAGQWFFAAIYILLVLFLSNSLGAFVLAMCLVPAVLLLGIRGQLLIAGIAAATVLLYPMLRGAGLVPVEQAVELAQSISTERADSLLFRVVNENALLDRANEKPFAGWGLFGRALLYDPETGRGISVPDGAWIIIIGAFGWIGYIAQFGLLTVPSLVLALRRSSLALSPATAGLALVMSANLLDLLPNATLTPITWLVGGALAGRCLYRVPADDPATAEATPAAAGRPNRPRRNWSLAGEGGAAPVARRKPRSAEARSRVRRGA